MRLTTDFNGPTVQTLDDLVEVRGAFVPRRLEGVVFTWHDGDEVSFTLTMDVEVVGEHVTCSRLVVEAGSQDVTKTMLGWIDPVFYGRHALALSGLVPKGERPGGR